MEEEENKKIKSNKKKIDKIFVKEWQEGSEGGCKGLKKEEERGEGARGAERRSARIWGEKGGVGVPGRKA